MTGRERVVRALEFNSPDRLPRNLWTLPGIEMFRKSDLDEVLETYPEDIFINKGSYGRGKSEKGPRYRRNEIGTDEWGCEWHAAEDGVVGEVKNPPLKDLSEVKHLRAPYEILEKANWSEVSECRQKTDKFILGWSRVRPFERMQFLLGTEKLFIELAYASKYLDLLRDILHEFFLKELALWGETEVDGILFMDDWGSQQNLLISPKMWRKFFKPLYKEYCEVIHSKNKYVFFHSDGNIEQIYPDLIEIGVDALNSQLFCMNIEELGKRYKGEITFFGEIDRQYILPFGTRDDIVNAVKRVKNALWMPEGGIIAQCEFGLKDPTENIKTVFETWESIV